MGRAGPRRGCAAGGPGRPRGGAPRAEHAQTLAVAGLSKADLVAGEQSTASASKARALDSWNAALTFVGEAPLRSYAELERAFWAAGVSDTSPGTQCDALQDPDGVSAALRGTRFEALLTC